MSNYKKFNINENVKVKLTEKGKTHLKKKHNELKHVYPQIGEYEPSPVDADGYTEYQMWDLLAKFGGTIPEYPSFGEAPFETNILIDIEDKS